MSRDLYSKSNTDLILMSSTDYNFQDPVGNIKHRHFIRILVFNSYDIKILAEEFFDHPFVVTGSNKIMILEHDILEFIIERTRIPGGMSSEPLYSGGYLFVSDGNGTLHAFSGKPDNNIALLNMQNSSVTVQQRQTYEITANIANYSDTPTKPVDIRFTLVTAAGEEFQRVFVPKFDEIRIWV